jgi:hypothetical protein
VLTQPVKTTALKLNKTPNRKNIGSLKFKRERVP